MHNIFLVREITDLFKHFHNIVKNIYKCYNSGFYTRHIFSKVLCKMHIPMVDL